MFIRSTIRTTLAFCLFCCAMSVAAQNTAVDIPIERAKAMTFVDANRYLDAYPILEKIAPLLPKDVDVRTHYAIALTTSSAPLANPVERKSERKRAYAALQKAKALGTQNVTALNFLDQMSPDGGDEDNFAAANPAVEKALREGEQYFGRGEYDKAFTSYEKAYKLDPKNYEAVVFMGDSLYAQRKYSEAEPWFAKAAAIDPDREMAFRFWGDALLFQGKIKEAQARFIDAFVAEPYSRNSWENINRLTEKYGKPFDVKGIFPPGTTGFGAIVIDAGQLSDKDGTKFWLKYSETRDSWRREIFKNQNPGSVYRRSLKEEVAALRAAADSAAAAIKSGALKEPHHSIVNLIEFRDRDILEPYVLFLSADEDIPQDYKSYRKANRDKLRRFLVDHVFVF